MNLETEVTEKSVKDFNEFIDKIHHDIKMFKWLSYYE